MQNLYSKRRRDWPAILKSYWKRAGDLAKSRQFDLIWVEAEVFPWLPAWAELWLSWGNTPYVLDYDDAAFHRYDLHAARPVRWLLGRKIDRVMSRSALVIAGNSYLAERALRAGAPRVETLPTFFPPFLRGIFIAAFLSACRSCAAHLDELEAESVTMGYTVAKGDTDAGKSSEVGKQSGSQTGKTSFG